MRHPTAPDAIAIKTEPNRTYPGYYVITVQCPYCARTHTHGWAGPGHDGGHRAPHCGDEAREINGKGYNIAIPANLEVTR